MMHPAGEVKRYTSVTVAVDPNSHRGRPGRGRCISLSPRPGTLRRSRRVHTAIFATCPDMPAAAALDGARGKPVYVHILTASTAITPMAATKYKAGLDRPGGGAMMMHPAGEVKRYTFVTATVVLNCRCGRPGRAEQGPTFRRPGHLRRSRLVHLSWLARFLSLPHLRHRLGAGILAACLSNCLSTCLSICLAGFITLCALTLSATPASADVNSELNRFWNNLGATSTFTDDMTRQLQDWYAGELPVKVAGRACHQPGPATSPPSASRLAAARTPANILAGGYGSSLTSCRRWSASRR